MSNKEQTSDNDSFSKLMDFDQNGEIDPADTFILYNMMTDDEDDDSDEDSFSFDDDNDSTWNSGSYGKTQGAHKTAGEARDEGTAEPKHQTAGKALENRTAKPSRESRAARNGNYEGYKLFWRITVTVMITAVLAGAFLSIIPVIMIRYAAEEFGKPHMISAAGNAIIAGIGVLIIIVIIYILGKAIYKWVKDLRIEKQKWLKQAEEGELEQYRHDRKRNFIILFCCIAAGIIILALVFANRGSSKPDQKTSGQKKEYYYEHGGK